MPKRWPMGPIQLSLPPRAEPTTYATANNLFMTSSNTRCQIACDLPFTLPGWVSNVHPRFVSRVTKATINSTNPWDCLVQGRTLTRPIMTELDGNPNSKALSIICASLYSRGSQPLCDLVPLGHPILSTRYHFFQHNYT